MLGRKNYYGTRSQWSSQLPACACTHADRSAAMFSIVQTCRMNGISPLAYPDYYFSECEKRGAAPAENRNRIIPSTFTSS